MVLPAKSRWPSACRPPSAQRSTSDAARHPRRQHVFQLSGSQPHLLIFVAFATSWRQTVLPLVQRTTAAPRRMAGSQPTGLSNLALQPDLDDIPALSSEQDSLWARLEKSSFLTDDEKRAAVGYGPKPPTASGKFNPYHDPRGLFTTPDGDGGSDVVPVVGGGRAPPRSPPGIGHNKPPGPMSPSPPGAPTAPSGRILSPPTNESPPSTPLIKPFQSQPLPGHSGNVFGDENGAQAP